MSLYVHTTPWHNTTELAKRVKSNKIWSVRRVQRHFELHENRSRRFHVTRKPVRRDLTAQSWTRWVNVRGYVYHRSSAFLSGLPCVALQFIDGINSGLPQVALLAFDQLLTHDTITPSPTSHFVIFLHDDGIAHLLVWVKCCVPIPYNSVVLINWKIISTVTDRRVTSDIEPHQHAMKRHTFRPRHSSVRI